jgi:uncharacterized protein YjbI with pentapeptide repeats
MEYATILPAHAKLFNLPVYSPGPELLELYAAGETRQAKKVAIDVHILNLEGRLGERHLRRLRYLKDFKNLTTVCFDGNLEAVSAILTDNITVLTMRHCNVEDASFTAFAKLQRLDLSASNARSECLGGLDVQDSVLFPQMSNLDISGTYVEEFNPLNFPALKYFNACCVKFDWSWVRDLQLEQLTVPLSSKRYCPDWLDAKTVRYIKM